MNGAPIVGNAKMWKPRASHGMETLVQHAIEGYGLMPAKGGNESLGEEEVRLAAGYIGVYVESITGRKLTLTEH